MTEQTEQDAVAQAAGSTGFAETMSTAWNLADGEGKKEILAISLGLVREAFEDNIHRAADLWIQSLPELTEEQLEDLSHRVHGIVAEAVERVAEQHGAIARRHVMLTVASVMLASLAEALPYQVDFRRSGRS